MPRRRFTRNPDKPASPRRQAPRAAASTVTVEALEPIVSIERAVEVGEVIELPRSAAERYVALGVARYAVPPLQEAVQRLHDAGCGIALPRRPAPEVQAAVGAVGATATAL